MAMIWIGLALLSAAALLPLGITIERGTRALGRREASFRLHRAQLVEIERDLGTGRIGEAERAGIVADAQRRLLKSEDEHEVVLKDGTRAPLLIALVAVPAIALALYLMNGSPNLPSVTGGSLVAEPALPQASEEKLLAELQARAASLPKDSAEARSAYIALGRAQADHGDMPAAAVAWSAALAIGFDPTLAAATAEAQSEAVGHVDVRAEALFRQALAHAPPDAPWRSMVSRRLAETSPQGGTQNSLAGAQN
jgi:cytochrome c-type biogenesis protein CcmH